MESLNNFNQRLPRKIVGNQQHMHAHGSHEMNSSNMALLQHPQQMPMHALMHPPPHAHLLGTPRMASPLMQPQSNVSHSQSGGTLLGASPHHQMEHMRITHIMNNEAHHSAWTYGPQFVMPPPIFATYGHMRYFVPNRQRMPACHPPNALASHSSHVSLTLPPSNGTSNMQPNNGNETRSSGAGHTNMNVVATLAPCGYVASSSCPPLAQAGNETNLIHDETHGSPFTQSGEASPKQILNIRKELPTPLPIVSPANKRNYFTFGKGGCSKVNSIIAMEEGFAPVQNNHEADCEEKRKEGHVENREETKALPSKKVDERCNNSTAHLPAHVSYEDVVSDVNSSAEGGIMLSDQEFANDEGAGGDSNMVPTPPCDASEEVTIPMGKYKELIRLALRGSEIAGKLACMHRNRPCFKKIDSLCARLKQDLIRPDSVLPNINSQGVAWAVKDFIFVFTRIISAWIIIKGYVFNTPEGLKKVIDALDDDFASRFCTWQDATHDFAESILKSFINLDNLIQSQKNGYQKPDGTNASPPSAATLLDETFEFLNSTAELVAPVKNYMFTMIEDSEGSQRQATANGTYFKTGTYNPIKKDAKDDSEQTALPSSPTPTSSKLPESVPTGGGINDCSKPYSKVSCAAKINAPSKLSPGNNNNSTLNTTSRAELKDMRKFNLDSQGCPQSMKMQYIPQTSSVMKTLSPASINSKIVTPKSNDFNGNNTVMDLSKPISSIRIDDFAVRNQDNAANGSNIGSSDDDNSPESADSNGNGSGIIDNAFGNNSGQNYWIRENNLSEKIDPNFTATNTESLEDRTKELPIFDENSSDDSMSAAISKMEAATKAAVAASFWQSPRLDSPPNWINYDIRVLNGRNELMNTDDVLNKLLLDKLNLLTSRLVNMDHSTLFFRIEFTRNYYPDFIALAENDDLMDLRSVIIKIESGAYTDINEVVRDIRIFIYATKEYLTHNPDLKLHSAVIAYEAEIDQILSQPPFELSDFEHITGAPGNTVKLGTSSKQSKKTKRT